MQYLFHIFCNEHYTKLKYGAVPVEWSQVNTGTTQGGYRDRYQGWAQGKLLDVYQHLTLEDESVK